jgi:molybdate transport system substrate-binding protein
MDELIKTFNKKYPNQKVKVTLGSSGKLTAQIKHRAPYDLFMAANMSYPNALYKEKIAVTKPIVYARGSLALLSSKPRNFKKGIALLQNKSIRKIAIANPKTAPYGNAAYEVFQNTKILDDIMKKLIYAESISSTVSYTVMAADFGLVATSSLYSNKMKRFKKNTHWLEIDKNLYTPIEQGIVILKRGENKKGVKLFYDFILSMEAKKILKDYGYIIN